MGEINFFWKVLSILKGKYIYIFGKISFFTVAQLVERWTLDLLDPVQMGSRDEFFFYIFKCKYYTFCPPGDQIMHYQRIK